MPKTNKDIAGKIVSFLREKDGEIEIGLNEAAKKFNSHPGTVSRIFKRLIGRGVIERTADPDLTGTKKPARYALATLFREGDGWREALKRKSSGGKSKTGPGVAAKHSERQTPERLCNEECLGARKVLLGELVEALERLKDSQEENRVLHLTVAELNNKVTELEDEIKSRGGACRQLREDVGKLETRLLTLRVQTSKPPSAAGKTLRADNSGTIILPSEGMPDTR